ncbi:MAG: hypothetical protein Kow0031_17300 [Anaerolineae bacterium]
MFSMLVLLLITIVGTAFFLLAPGWYWLLGTLILLLVWLGYLFLVFPHKPVSSRGFLAFLGWFMLAAVIIASVVAWGIQATGLPLKFQIDSLNSLAFFEERVLALLLGALGGFVLTLIFFVMVGYFSSIYVLALHEEDMTFFTAFKSFIFLIFNFSLAWLVVEDGKIIEVKKQGFTNEWLSRGKIFVKPGNAIVTDRGGRITGIHGPGVVFTQKNERIREVFDLRPQFWVGNVENVMTADRIPLDIELGVGYRITPYSGPMPPPPNTVLHEREYDAYPVQIDTLRRAAFNTTAGRWSGFCQGAPGVQLRDQIMTHTIDQLFTVAGPLMVATRQIQQIEQQIQTALNAFANANFGVTITTVDIRQMNLPEDIKDAIHTRLKANAEAEAITAIESRRNEARGQLVTRILNAISTGTGSTIGQTELQLATIFAQISRRALTDDVLGHQYIEMLKAMSTGDATKIFNVTPEPVHIEPGHLPQRENGKENGNHGVKA